MACPPIVTERVSIASRAQEKRAGFAMSVVTVRPSGS